MGNCLKPMMIPGDPHEENKPEERKPLVTSTLHDQVVFGSNEYPKKKKKVRFNLQADNAAAETIMETTIEPTAMKRSVRVKVILTQSELKQILNRATIDHQPPLQTPSSSSSVDGFTRQIMVKGRRSRSASVMCNCRCSWNPALQTIHESGHY